MKSLTTAILFISCCALVTACDFDGQRQLDLQYPVTLEILNKSENHITIKSIYNSADTTAGFVFKGDTIQPGQSFKLNISESTYEAISSGKYFFEGNCKDNKKWLANGKHLKRLSTHNNGEWKITISLLNCNNHP